MLLNIIGFLFTLQIINNHGIDFHLNNNFMTLTLIQVNISVLYLLNVHFYRYLTTYFVSLS